MIDNSLKRLLEQVEPKIQDIEKNRIEKNALESVHKTMDELMTLGENFNGILDFYDQDFIFKAIKIGNSNADFLIEKYQSSRYLLKNTDNCMLELPQFKDALNFMDSLYKYLYGLNERITLDYETKAERLQIQELNNKYYNLLGKDNFFVKDVDEFLEFLDLNNLDIENRINILKIVNEKNIQNYITTNDITIDGKIYLSDVTSLLHKNKKLIGQEYFDDDSELNEYLNKHLDNLEECLHERKIYLINKIYKYYKNKEYKNIIEYYLDCMKILDFEKEVEKQKNCSHKLVFLFKNDKSLVREYLDKTAFKFKSCVYKNLLDLENNSDIKLPSLYYYKKYLYIKDDFVVKTIYTYVDNFIFVLGVLDKGEKIEEFLSKNEYLLNEAFTKDKLEYNEEERNLILKNITVEDLVVSIDLDTLDIKMEDNNGR